MLILGGTQLGPIKMSGVVLESLMICGQVEMNKERAKEDFPTSFFLIKLPRLVPVDVVAGLS